MRNITEEGFAYLRNINTQPGPNAGRSIDPSKPGPDVDRIATAAKRCWRKGANVRLKTMRPFEFFGTVYEQDSHAVTVIYDDNKLATFHADDLIEQETPSPAPSPGPQDVREGKSDFTHALDAMEAFKQRPDAADLDPTSFAAGYVAALAQSDAQPAAWRYAYRSYPNHWHLTTLEYDIDRARDKGCIIEPLYTTSTALPRLDASGLMKAAELPLDVLQSAGEYLCMDWDPATTTAVEAVSVIWNIITNALRARAADRSGK